MIIHASLHQPQPLRLRIGSRQFLASAPIYNWTPALLANVGISDPANKTP